MICFIMFEFQNFRPFKFFQIFILICFKWDIVKSLNLFAEVISSGSAGDFDLESLLT